MEALDDTTLGRPGRHVRGHSHRPDLRELADADALKHADGRALSPEELAEYRAERRRFERRAAAENAAKRRERLLRKAAIPSVWQGLTFDDLEVDERKPAIDAARQWGEGELRGLILWGGVGRGKTRMAATAALERVKHGIVRWLNIADLVMDLRGGFSSPNYEEARSLLKPIPGCALVLDDLDKLKPTDHAVQPIYLAVNAFTEAELPLLVTMNRELDDLAEDFGERFGEAIASRLAGYCRQVEVGGRDRRLEP